MKIETIDSSDIGVNRLRMSVILDEVMKELLSQEWVIGQAKKISGIQEFSVKDYERTRANLYQRLRKFGSDKQRFSLVQKKECIFIYVLGDGTNYGEPVSWKSAFIKEDLEREKVRR